MKYTFKLDSPLDKKLTNAWKECYYYRDNSKDTWERFLESFPEVESAIFDRKSYSTVITFEDESELSLFLLRWS